MNYPAVQGIAIVQSHWSDNTPRRDGDAQPFTAENCTGYTAEDIQKFNAEFLQRWNAGEWAQEGDALQAFQKEISGR